MTPTDRPRFAAILTGFAELKGRALSHAALDLFWAAMQQWSIEDFAIAAAQLVRTCAFMPTPKDFEDLRKAGRPTAGEAWLKARAAAPSAIVNGHVTTGGSCGDAIIDRAVRAIGGYGLIYTTEIEKLPFLERRFCEHYESMRDANDTREALPQIASSTDRSKSLNAEIAKLTREKTVQ